MGAIVFVICPGVLYTVFLTYFEVSTCGGGELHTLYRHRV